MSVKKSLVVSNGKIKLISPSDILFDPTRGRYLSSGMVEEPVLTDNENGSVTVASEVVKLYSEGSFLSELVEYVLAEKIITLTDETTNYIIADYNSGSPEYSVITDVSLINESDIIPVYTIFRMGASLRILSWDALASGLPNKIHARFVKTNRFAKEGDGLVTTEKNTRELSITSGIVWVGAHSVSLNLVDSAVNPTTLIHHTASVWDYTSVTQYNNTQYDNGTGLQTLTTGRYAVNWIYREIATLGRIGILLGTGDYKLNEALEASPIKQSNLPFGLPTQGLLITKVIVQKDSDTVYIIEDWSEGMPIGFSAGIAARAIPIADDEDYYEGGNVEDLFQEIGETKFWNGFNLQLPNSNGTLTWVAETRTVNLAVKNEESEFYYWSQGKKVPKIITYSVIIPDVTGIYYVYFNSSGVLQYILDSEVSDIIFYNFAIVAVVRWNAIQGSGGCGNERHGIHMSAATHIANHETFGALYISGFDITGLSDGSPTYTQTNSGKFRDEDIRHLLDAQTTHPFMYRFGADGDWYTATADNHVGLKEAADTYYSWNEWTGSTWQLTEGGNTTDYFITFFIATPSIISASGVVKIVGHNAYSSVTNARTAIETEKRSLSIDGLPGPEITFLYAIIVKRDGNVQELADGSLYYDLRGTSSRGGGGDSGVTPLAADFPTDTSNFDNILSSADINIQLALETLDEHSHTADEVGLGNVTNEAQIPLTQKGSNSGVAELDTNGKVPSAQLPAYVDDVLEYANFAALPVTGESGIIYITLDDNTTYRWSGSAYVEIGSSLTLGETAATAYRGDRGKIAYDHSQATHASSDADKTATVIHAASSITTPVDADELGIIDSTDSNILKKLSIANLKATFKTYFDSLYGTLSNIVEDLTPQWGADVDVNGHSLGDGTLELLKFSETASAVNEITIKNAATGDAPEVQATGDDTNIDLILKPKGTGAIDGSGNAQFNTLLKEHNIGSTSSNIICDCSKYNIFRFEPGADIDANFTNMKNGGIVSVRLTGGDDHTITWKVGGATTNFKFDGGSEPSWSAGTGIDQATLLGDADDSLTLVLFAMGISA